MDWKTCINENNSIKIMPNEKRAVFLIKRSEETLNIIGRIKLNEENASVFFANYYDALLEILHALMYSKGYKVKNHYCLGYYIRDVMKDGESFNIFDRARSVRNSIIYYGNRFDFPVYLELIQQITGLCNKLKRTVK